MTQILIDFDIVFHRFIENSLETPSFLLDYGQKLLDKLEITTQIYQSIGEEKISDLLYIENALIILMVFLVLFEAYLIFSPAFTAVYKENLLLKRNQLSLERKIEEEIQKRQEQEAILIQKAKLAEMGEMLNNIAHQWKQPLNVLLLIVGSIKMMNNTHKDTNLSDDIETMSDQIKFMSSTIDTFRSFYQPDRKSVNFSLKEAIRSVQKILQMELKQKRINFNITGDDIAICGYENEFKQIILNLITNAKDSITEAINKNLIDQGEIEFAISRGGGGGRFALIHAKDNGIGISKDVQEKIFNPYFTTKENGSGTGIGLYMIRTILERHFAGSIELVQPADRGAVFVIRIALQNSSLCL